MLKRLRALLNQPTKSSGVEFFFIALIVAAITVVSEVKIISEWNSTVVLLVIALKLFLAILSLAIVWGILLVIYRSLKNGPESKIQRKNKTPLKDYPLLIILFPIILIWIITVYIQDIFLTRRWPGPGFKYIKVNEDGTAREVTQEERDYLTQKFDPGDGARPYIKFGYESRTPDGKLKGFLKRRHLPQNIVIEPVGKKE